MYYINNLKIYICYIIYIMLENNNVLMNLNGVDFYINDENNKHFQSLPKHQQEAIKQIMILEMLKGTYD